jgi:hypothetical protein
MEMKQSIFPHCTYERWSKPSSSAEKAFPYSKMEATEFATHYLTKYPNCPIYATRTPLNQHQPDSETLRPRPPGSALQITDIPRLPTKHKNVVLVSQKVVNTQPSAKLTLRVGPVLKGKLGPSLLFPEKEAKSVVLLRRRPWEPNPRRSRPRGFGGVPPRNKLVLVSFF